MNTRQQIIDATIELIQTKGLVGATTREIARTANVAEGTLYNHFSSKEELFLEAIRAPLPTFVAILEKQIQRVGEGELAENLFQIAQAAIEYYLYTIPQGSALFADPALLTRYQEKLQALDTGPQRIIARVAAYMQAEQRFGRLRKELNAQVLALLLIGPCFQYAYTQRFTGHQPFSLTRQDFVKELVNGLLISISPEAAPLP